MHDSEGFIRHAFGEEDMLKGREKNHTNVLKKYSALLQNSLVGELG